MKSLTQVITQYKTHETYTKSPQKHGTHSNSLNVKLKPLIKCILEALKVRNP